MGAGAMDRFCEEDEEIVRMKEHRPRGLVRIVGLIACVAFVNGFSLAESFGQERSRLIENSPFLPEGYQPPQTNQRPPREPPPPPPRGPEPLDKIEFRGMTTIGGEPSFSLFDPEEKRSYWIPLGRTDGGFTIVDYKEDEEAVVVRHNNRNRTISLHEATIAAMPVQAPTPPTNRRGGRREQAQEAQDPEERMQNLQEEIRRRRELRRAALERTRTDSQ